MGWGCGKRTRELSPGEKGGATGRLVIWNGGSLSTYQAIQGGTPVLGIVGNLDQHLNMNHLACSGIGEALRSEYADIDRIRDLAKQLLNEARYKDTAKKAQLAAQNYDVKARLSELIKNTLHPQTPKKSHNQK